MAKKKKWAEMSTLQRVVMVLGGIVQVALAVAAWVDLAKRSADQVKGPKGRWAGIIVINFVCPIA